MNHISSRSHTLYRLTVESMPQSVEDSAECDSPDRKSTLSSPFDLHKVSTSAILNFVDLAGSEKANIHETSYRS
jgi:hypothetical protein